MNYNQYAGNRPPVVYQPNGPIFADGSNVPPDMAKQQQFQAPYVAQPYQPHFQQQQGYQQPHMQTSAPSYTNNQTNQPSSGPQQNVVIIQNRDACSYCKGNLYIEKKVGCIQICACVCLFFVFWPICWIPFVVEGCYEQHYVCAKCHSFNGRVQRDY